MNKVYHVEDGGLFKIEESTSSTITVFLKTKDAKIEYRLENGDYRILVFPLFEEELSLAETGEIKNSQVEISYLELGNHSYHQDTNLHVKDRSTLKVRSIYLGVSGVMKNVRFDILNESAHTEVNVDNSAVCLQDSALSLDVIGTIQKGAKGSIHHQKSRCLTIGSLKKALVRPVLNIDENDVEASHSLSSGTIDEDILYYMNTRGLNKKEALLLMIESYLLPDHSFFEGFEEGERIEEMMKEKVKNVCLM